ncbi:retrovirus-related Pol polyprotein from transposon 17.6 [Trichonephila clavipes]|nr:retrovirus-related Pol polyprotein from transposon 17.6 [Trichonephila clavipes]
MGKRRTSHHVPEQKAAPCGTKNSTTQKECAVNIFAVQKLKCYLDGHSKFVIQTDHNPLAWLEKNTGTNPRLLRWSLILQSFNYEIAYWKGKQN